MVNKRKSILYKGYTIIRIDTGKYIVLDSERGNMGCDSLERCKKRIDHRLSSIELAHHLGDVVLA